MVRSVLVAAAGLSMALAASSAQQPVCKVVTTVVTGSPVWVTKGADPTSSWGVWSSSSSKPVDPVSSSSTWANWDPTTSKTSTKTPSASSSVWSDWASSSSSSVSKSTTTKSGGDFFPTSSSSSTTTWVLTTTSTSTTTDSTTTTTTTTTSAAPTCEPTGSTFSGSCDCGFDVHSASKMAIDMSGTAFFEKTSGELVQDLNTCLQYCNDNEECSAVVYVNDPAYSSDTQDYLHCWQVSGAGGKGNTVADGFANIAFKNNCCGTCSSNYGA